MVLDLHVEEDQVNHLVEESLVVPLHHFVVHSSMNQLSDVTSLIIAEYLELIDLDGNYQRRE